MVSLPLALALGRPTASIAQSRFSDVPPNHWAAGAVNEMAALGILRGYPAPARAARPAASRLPPTPQRRQRRLPLRKAAADGISFPFVGAVAIAFAQIQAPRPAPGQPGPGSQGSQGSGRPLTPPGSDPDSQYRLGPDSLPQEGVPKGEIRGPYTLPSQVYPGTQHTYWVYVPAQYDPAVPAALMVFQDGQAFKDEKGDMRAQNVMDNLIYRREIPVMLGVFINPGRRPDQPEPTPKNWGDRDTNRPTEYNSLDDKYARVITEELMPALQKDYNISKDPELHGIGGSSSGAIAAFTVAWERPDHFRKVLSNVGSFVNLRGGHVYPEKVLAGAKKPIRVFLCDGRNDNRGLRGTVYDEK